MIQKIYFSCLLALLTFIPYTSFAAVAGFTDFSVSVVEEKLVVFTATASFAVNDRTMLAPQFGSTTERPQQFSYTLQYDGKDYAIPSIGFVLPELVEGSGSYTFGPDARQTFTTIILAPLPEVGADASLFTATLTTWPLAEIAQ